jgi:hypothetical protein
VKYNRERDAISAQEVDRMTAQPLRVQNESRFPVIQPHTDESIHQLLQLLDEWMADESGYDEAAWADLKAGLDLESNTTI